MSVVILEDMLMLWVKYFFRQVIGGSWYSHSY